MIVYHVDKFGVMFLGQRIKATFTSHASDPKRTARIKPLNSLYNSHFQLFAMSVLDFPGDDDITMWYTEFFLEYIRALKYPSLPSRFTVLFGARTVECAKQWSTVLSPNGSQSRILALKTLGKVYSANALFRDMAYDRINALLPELLSRHTNPLKPLSQPPATSASQLLTDVLSQSVEPALQYWRSLSRVYFQKQKPRFEYEELLLVPPVYVVDQVFP